MQEEKKQPIMKERQIDTLELKMKKGDKPGENAVREGLRLISNQVTNKPTAREIQAEQQ